MMIQNLLMTNESYTYDNWVHTDCYTHFSRLYYILGGEAYYQKGNLTIPLQKNHLYLFPAKTHFSLYENPKNKLLHTYAHITTLPIANRLTVAEVLPNTCLWDAVSLWRKYLPSADQEELKNILQLVLSCLDAKEDAVNPIAQSAKQFLDTYPTFDLTLEELSRHVGYSKIHINRVFFDAYKTTPMRYFNDLRMEQGMQKLLEGISVSEISQLLNYSTPAAFSKAFKQKFGYSPEKYLKRFPQ